MAGAGYKLFNTGDVLTAAQVNTYLMQQTVMVFASSAARTSALSGVLAEGMVSYLQDTNTLEVYDGSAWVGATGDITGLTAGTGISISSATGPVPTITNSVATTFDALGDLVVGTGADTFSKLTVGANGESIVADSSTSTGLRWNPSSTTNQVYNSQFNIWQRGTSINTISAINYTADRWNAWTLSAGGSLTTSRQTTSDTTNLPFIQYCARVQRTAGNTNTGICVFGQVYESNESIKYMGKTITVSFYARKGSNYSEATSSLGLQMWTNTTTDASLSTVQAGSTVAFQSTNVLTTTWQRFTATGTLSSSHTQMALAFLWSPTGTAGANDYFEITGVQMQLGSVPTAYVPMSATLAGELAACQRYYYRQTSGSIYGWMAYGGCQNTTNGQAGLVLPVQMRIVPTALEYANVRVVDSSYGATTLTSIALITSESTPNLADLYITATGLTGGRPLYIGANNNTGAYLAVTAEL